MRCQWNEDTLNLLGNYRVKIRLLMVLPKKLWKLVKPLAYFTSLLPRLLTGEDESDVALDLSIVVCFIEHEPKKLVLGYNLV